MGLLGPLHRVAVLWGPGGRKESRGPGAGPDRGSIPLAQGPGRVSYMAAVKGMKDRAEEEKEPYPEGPLPSGAG